MHQLHLPGFLDPEWMAKMHGEREGVATGPSTVLVENERLSLVNPEEIILEPGEKVWVSVYRYAEMRTDREKQEEEQQQQERAEQREAQKKAEAVRYREECREFNEGLNVPVGWVPGLKPVLSGLSANSAGNGTNARTRYHVMFLKPLHDGLLDRDAGDFLCSPNPEQNGKQWLSDASVSWLDHERCVVRPKVTCASCLKIARRKWAKK